MKNITIILTLITVFGGALQSFGQQTYNNGSQNENTATLEQVNSAKEVRIHQSELLAPESTTELAAAESFEILSLGYTYSDFSPEELRTIERNRRVLQNVVTFVGDKAVRILRSYKTPAPGNLIE